MMREVSLIAPECAARGVAAPFTPHHARRRDFADTRLRRCRRRRLQMRRRRHFMQIGVRFRRPIQVKCKPRIGAMMSARQRVRDARTRADDAVSHGRVPKMPCAYLSSTGQPPDE